MSITNLDQMHKSERLSSDARNKNYKTKYNFKLRDKSNNITDYFDNTQDISAINKLNTIISYDVYKKQKEENDENKSMNIPDNINTNTFNQTKNKYQYYGISRNYTNDLNLNAFGENEKKEKNIRNYNEINPYST